MDCWLCDASKYKTLGHNGHVVDRMLEEDDNTYVVVPRHSHVRYHLLVVLKKKPNEQHKQGLIMCSVEDQIAMAKTCARWCEVLKGMEYDTVYSGCYSDEGHAHYHLIPFMFGEAKGFSGSAMQWLGYREMFSDKHAWQHLSGDRRSARLKEIESVVADLKAAASRLNK